MKLLRFLIIWVAVAAAFAGALTFLPGFTEYTLLLYKDHASATGVVLSTDVSNHLSATVRFTASGRVFEQAISACDCRVGSSVVVYYYTRDPSIASVITPEYWHDANLGLVIWGSLAGAMAGAGQWIRWARKHPARIASDWRADAKVLSLSLLLGAAIAGTGGLQAGLFRGWALASIPLVLGGMLILVVRIWQAPRGQGWPQIMRSPLFVAGAASALAGIVVSFKAW